MQVFATTKDIPEGLVDTYDLIDITESVIKVRDLSKRILERENMTDMAAIRMFGDRLIERMMEVKHPSAQAGAGMLTAFLNRIEEGEHLQ